MQPSGQHQCAGAATQHRPALQHRPNIDEPRRDFGHVALQRNDRNHRGLHPRRQAQGTPEERKQRQPCKNDKKTATQHDVEQDDQSTPEHRRWQRIDDKEMSNGERLDERILVEPPGRRANSLSDGQRGRHGEPCRRRKRQGPPSEQHQVRRRTKCHSIRHAVKVSRCSPRIERDEKRTAESQNQQVDAETRHEEQGTKKPDERVLGGVHAMQLAAEDERKRRCADEKKEEDANTHGTPEFPHLRAKNREHCVRCGGSLSGKFPNTPPQMSRVAIHAGHRARCCRNGHGH